MAFFRHSGRKCFLWFNREHAAAQILPLVPPSMGLCCTSRACVRFTGLLLRAECHGCWKTSFLNPTSSENCSDCRLPDLSPHVYSDPTFFLLPRQGDPYGARRIPFQTKARAWGILPVPTCWHSPSNPFSSLTEELCDSEDVSYGFGLRNPLWQHAEIWYPGTGQILGTDYSGSSSSGSAGWSDNATEVRDLQVTKAP